MTIPRTINNVGFRGLVVERSADLIKLRAYQEHDRTWVEETNVRCYRTVHNFDATFADVVSAALDLLEHERSRTGSTYLIAQANEKPVGCIFLSAETPIIGRIRLFYLEEEFRGRGIGLRLLRTVLAAAKEAKLETIRVATFDVHAEACRLYEALGFELLKAVSVEAFGKAMVQVEYQLRLGADCQ